MISDNSIKQISHIFCGDIEGYYLYKSGGVLVGFFNEYYHVGDRYGQGFPSRWAYVYDKLVDLLNKNRIDSFFNIILSKEYLMKEQSLSEVEASEKAEIILKELNRLVRQDLYSIVKKNGKYHLIRENDDLEFIGGGGFANVYRQKSTGLIVKKLKDDFLTDKAIRSRFKREYNITKSLQDTYGIIKVYTFDEGNCTYTMEPAEKTLEKYVLDNELSVSNKINCIRQILYIMKSVHEKDIIHRDISANNIFVLSGMLKIADFGLGKNLKVFTSHQTVHSKAMGQYFYCAPEQFMMLRDGDKRSDVYSLGRIINFIMTEDPRNSIHIFRNIAEKATNSDAAYRYADAGQLSLFFEKAVNYYEQGVNREKIKDKIARRIFDEEIENFIYSLSPEQISKEILNETTHFTQALFKFMESNEQQAQHIIQSIDRSFRDICGRSFEAHDPFAQFAYTVINSNFSFVVKEIAASILRYVAFDVNRFSAQHLVENLKQEGIDPMLEDLLNG